MHRCARWSVALLLLALCARARRARVEMCTDGLISSVADTLVCCPVACGHCDASRCNVTHHPECCPVTLAKHNFRTCRNETQTACHWRWLAPSAKDPLWRPRRVVLDEPASRGETVHVAVASDGAQLVGAIACARSVLVATATPSRVSLHILTSVASVATARATFACALTGFTDRWRVVAFDGDATFQQRGLEIRPIEDLKKAALASSSLNYARFYLSELLEDVDKVIYLDADVVVLGDACALWDSALLDGASADSMAVAAAPRAWKKICGSFINCKDVSATKTLAKYGLHAPYEQSLHAFNAGVLVMRLDRWKKLKLCAAVETWINRNFKSKAPLYKLGSNPPLMLAVGQNFEHLDPAWNCQRGEACWDTPLRPSALHWSGAHKPWSLSFERDTFEWLPFIGEIDRSCLGPDILLNSGFAVSKSRGASNGVYAKYRRKAGLPLGSGAQVTGAARHTRDRQNPPASMPS